MKKYFGVFILIFISNLLPAFASGIMVLTGKLISITEKEYAVETKSSIYYVNRKALPPDESKNITKTEIPVVFHVSFDAIDRVKKK